MVRGLYSFLDGLNNFALKDAPKASTKLTIFKEHHNFKSLAYENYSYTLKNEIFWIIWNDQFGFEQLR